MGSALFESITKGSFFMRNEIPVIMLAHGVLVGWFFYLFFKLILKQGQYKAEGRAIIIGLLFSLYFVLFGLRPPLKINPMLI
tara:strand:- start:8935 stop:9180 length:246 start_codon:yes stop_codon:yes gene_type:complete